MNSRNNLVGHLIATAQCASLALVSLFCRVVQAVPSNRSIKSSLNDKL